MNSRLLHDSLRRLVPHVDIARVALTGGVAIGIHIDVMRDGHPRGDAAEDIDFVAEDVDAVRATVANDFLVSHFHLPQPGYAKFLIQLVDPVTRLRLDVFPDALRALARAHLVQVDGISLRMLDVYDLLEHKIALLSKASAANPVDEKHYVDARRLAAICGRLVPPTPAAHLTTVVYSQDINEVCVRCEASRHTGFPLAPKQRIFDVLGYV